MFALLDTIMHAMLANDHHHRVAAVQFLMVPAALVLNYILISRLQGNGAAIAVLSTLAFGVVVALIWAGMTYGAPVRLATAVRSVLATLVACAISWFWVADGFFVIVKLACLVIVYGVVLFISGELGRDDLEALAVWKKA
jgi:O-antigen/teichoic acid export membrane protein